MYMKCLFALIGPRRGVKSDAISYKGATKLLAQSKLK